MNEKERTYTRERKKGRKEENTPQKALRQRTGRKIENNHPLNYYFQIPSFRVFEIRAWLNPSNFKLWFQTSTPPSLLRTEKRFI